MLQVGLQIQYARPSGELVSPDARECNHFLHAAILGVVTPYS